MSIAVAVLIVLVGIVVFNIAFFVGYLLAGWWTEKHP